MTSTGLAMQKRAEYLAQALSRSKLWEAYGISRRTWERRGKPMMEPVASPVAGPPVASMPPEPVASPAVAGPPPAAVASPPQLPLIASSHGPGRCAQCNGLSDGQEREVVIDQKRVLLHPECLRFWRNPATRHPNVGGSWG
jgi:hypothetical protein